MSEKRIVIGVVLACLLLPASTSAMAQRKVYRNEAGETALQAMREYNWRAPEFANALPLKEGDTLVVYGMCSANYLKEFLRRVGPEGRVYAVFRMEPNYLNELSAGMSREDPRLQPVFAADGDAHLEDGIADLVIAMDLFGFYRREDALYRQAHQVLEPDGLLIQVRARRRTEAEYEQLHGASPEGITGRQLAYELNRQRLAVTQHGFEYVDEISLFETRTIRVFRSVNPS
jgi:SAM-dependent methyltransferase